MQNEQSYRIVKLTASNVKRIEAVEIEPDGNVVVIGGDNGQGKSSVLDSILYGLVGKKSMPPKPVRSGEGKSEIKIDLGDFEVIRTIKENSTQTLKIQSKDGSYYSSPQQKLDAIVSELSFDPVEFMNKPTKAQAETLKKLVGLDFEELDKKRQQLYEERTMVNRDVKRCESTLSGMEYDANYGTETTDINELMNKERAANEIISKYQSKKNELERSEELLSTLRTEKEELERKLGIVTERICAGVEKLKLQRVELESIELPDVESVRKEINYAQAKNRIVESNKSYNATKSELKEHSNKSAQLTKSIEDIDSEKKTALVNAKFPVSGLSINDDGVVFEGVPLEQASSAEKLKVCAAIGCALNPKLRFITIRDGSLLDKNSMQVLEDFAEENDVQVWIERVGDHDKGAIIIEEGKIKGSNDE
jgi:DNA repair exonuclease SbcCD ATPase subunit